MNIGLRIKELRGKMSQKDYANKFGVALNTLRNYESGYRTPNVEFLCALADATGVSIQWLITGVELSMSGKNPETSQKVTDSTLYERCAALESELREERKMNRDLVAENRQLWKGNGELKVKIGELNVQNVKLEGELDTARTMAKEYYERLQARAAPEEDTPPEATRDCA